jgi:hypothetical protein
VAILFPEARLVTLPANPLCIVSEQCSSSESLTYFAEVASPLSACTQEQERSSSSSVDTVRALYALQLSCLNRLLLSRRNREREQ